jgi:hypothetical protein
VLTPDPDHFINNTGLSFQFQVVAVSKYVFSFAPERGTPGSCAPIFIFFERNIVAPLPWVRFGFSKAIVFLKDEWLIFAPCTAACCSFCC